MPWDTFTIVVNVGYVLMLAGFLVRDVLWLRSALMAGQACVTLYGWVNHRIPVAFWNGLFMVINGLWVARIVRERRPVRIPDALRDLYERVFSAMTPPEFLAFWGSGRTDTWADRVAVREGSTPDAVHLVLEGAALVEHGGRTLTRLERGDFLAEMSFLTGQPASADIRGDGKLVTRAWPQAHLRDLRTAKPALFMKIQGILGCDLAAKIRDANRAMAGAAH